MLQNLKMNFMTCKFFEEDYHLIQDSKIKKVLIKNGFVKNPKSGKII